MFLTSIRMFWGLPSRYYLRRTGFNLGGTFCRGKLSDAQSTRQICCKKEVEGNVMSASKPMFTILLIHMPFQGVFTKDIYHGTIMIFETKTILCTIRATYYAKTTWISWKQNAAQSSYCTNTRTQCVPLKKIYPVSRKFPPPPPPTSNIQYPVLP